MFNESFAEGDSALAVLEKSSAETGADADADATFTGWSGNLIKVILYFYNMTKYIILYRFLLNYIN
jgi:hypothetical protein